MIYRLHEPPQPMKTTSLQRRERRKRKKRGKPGRLAVGSIARHRLVQNASETRKETNELPQPMYVTDVTVLDRKLELHVGHGCSSDRSYLAFAVKEANSNDEHDCPGCIEMRENNSSTALQKSHNGKVGELEKKPDFPLDNENDKIKPSSNGEQHRNYVSNQMNLNISDRQRHSDDQRRSKLIEVDGTNYIVTKEPPGTGSSRSFSVPAFEFPAHLRKPQKTDANRVPHLSNGLDCNDVMIAQGLSWQSQRDAKTTVVNIEQCAAHDVIEPHKIEALDQAALRLRRLMQILKDDVEVSKETLQRNLQYSVDVLESNYIKMKRFNRSSDDEVLENLSKQTPVPEEIKSWLVETFSNKKLGGEKNRAKKDRRSLRSVVRTVQAGMILDRLWRKPAIDLTQDYLSPDVIRHLKDIDKWTFDIFELEKLSNGNALTCVCYQLLTKYDLIKRLKIPAQSVFSYCSRLQRGYRKHSNRYHNPVHAADVAQTLNCLITESGFVNWFSDLEIFSMIMAAVVHDVEHTGTTNNFHINTRSNLAMLYNDRSVLEHHHVSTAFRFMQEEGCNILRNFPKEDYQDCRSLMVEMVLATDMNQHFEQTKHMETALQRPDLLEKSKAMCLLLHSSDINHPSKPWTLHHPWTKRLVFEFFDQGDRERKLDLAISPLCDRHSARVAQSQIGFIDFVVFPTFSTLFNLFAEINGPSIAAFNNSKTDEDQQSESTASSADIRKCRFGDVDVKSLMGENDSSAKRLERLKETLFACIRYNKSQWVRKEKIETEEKLFGEQAFDRPFVLDPIPPECLACFENGDGAKLETTNDDHSFLDSPSKNSKPP